MYPNEGVEIKNDKLVLTKDFIEHQIDLCQFAADRSKEQGLDNEFTYFNGRAGVFKALLENWKYYKPEEDI